MDFYIPNNFVLEELIPPELFEEWKDMKWKVWMSIDYRALKTLQNLRDRYGKMRMNNWHNGGPNQYKGLRPMDYKGLTYLSMHKWFMAFDPTPLSEDPNKIRQDILNDPFHEDFKYITCLEMDISWLHFDIRNWDKINKGIYLVDKNGRGIY